MGEGYLGLSGWAQSNHGNPSKQRETKEELPEICTVPGLNVQVGEHEPRNVGRFWNLGKVRKGILC